MDRKSYEKAVDDVYKVVTDYLIEKGTDLDFNLVLQNKILDLKYKAKSNACKDCEDQECTKCFR